MVKQDQYGSAANNYNYNMYDDGQTNKVQ